jgi:hypothetical protein
LGGLRARLLGESRIDLSGAGIEARIGRDRGAFFGADLRDHEWSSDDEASG